jgi:hypothetical protein
MCTTNTSSFSSSTITPMQAADGAVRALLGAGAVASLFVREGVEWDASCELCRVTVRLVVGFANGGEVVDFVGPFVAPEVARAEALLAAAAVMDAMPRRRPMRRA